MQIAADADKGKAIGGAMPFPGGLSPIVD